MNSFSACILPASRDVITEFPRIPPPAGAFIIYFGRSPRRRPRFVRDKLHLCTKYELICSFNTFCTCIPPYYVQKTYKTTYEFHFQLAFSRRVVTSLRSSLASRRPGDRSLYLSGILRVGDPVLYIFTVFSVLNTN